MREIERVTRPGGMMVSLDFFLPANRVFRELYGHRYVQGAAWGRRSTAGREFTPTSPIRSAVLSTTADFALLQQMGYSSVDQRAFILGGIGLHWAVKR